MIKVVLDTQSYCDNCSAYEPVVKNTTSYADNQAYLHTTVVSCKFKEHCRHLHTYFKDEAKK